MPLFATQGKGFRMFVRRMAPHIIGTMCNRYGLRRDFSAAGVCRTIAAMSFRRDYHRLKWGFVSISHKMARTAANAGTPHTNQMRKS